MRGPRLLDPRPHRGPEGVFLIPRPSPWVKMEGALTFASMTGGTPNNQKKHR